MKSTKGEMQAIVLSSSNVYKPQQWPAWQHILKGAIEAVILWGNQPPRNCT